MKLVLNMMTWSKILQLKMEQPRLKSTIRV